MQKIFIDRCSRNKTEIRNEQEREDGGKDRRRRPVAYRQRDNENKNNCSDTQYLARIVKQQHFRGCGSDRSQAGSKL